jgi:hypothetical protein
MERRIGIISTEPTSRWVELLDEGATAAGAQTHRIILNENGELPDNMEGVRRIVVTSLYAADVRGLVTGHPDIQFTLLTARLSTKEASRLSAHHPNLEVLDKAGMNWESIQALFK